MKEFYKTSSNNFRVFSDIYISERKKRIANITAFTKCKIWILEAYDFFRICEKNTTIGYYVIKNLVDMICDKFENFSTTVLLDNNKGVLWN